MGNGYNHHFHHQKLGVHQKSTFLPMLCSRPSIKDVVLPKFEDPLSPKIGCMGQVKRNNKINGFPTTSHNKLTITTKNNNNNVKYFKLKKLFSGKNLTANNTATTTATCTRKEVSDRRRSKFNEVSKESGADVCINIFEMDPPLPVIKKVAKADDKKEEENSIWKRRSSGGALKSLELQQIQIPRHRLEINTV